MRIIDQDASKRKLSRDALSALSPYEARTGAIRTAEEKMYRTPPQLLGIICAAYRARPARTCWGKNDRSFAHPGEYFIGGVLAVEAEGRNHLRYYCTCHLALLDCSA